MQDILLGNDGDIQIVGNDIVIGLSDNQHIDILLVTEKGSFKENPLIGVGVQSFLESEDEQALLSEMRKQFMADGLTIDALNIDNGKFELDAHY